MVMWRLLFYREKEKPYCMYQLGFQADIFFFKECFKVFFTYLFTGCFGKCFERGAFVKAALVVNLIKNTAQAICAYI